MLGIDCVLLLSMENERKQAPGGSCLMGVLLASIIFGKIYFGGITLDGIIFGGT